MTIDRPSDIPALRRLWKQAFGDTDAFLDNFFRTGFSPERCRCITLDGQLTAALYWFDCQWAGRKLAYLYAVATDEAFRGKGLCRALMEDTHRHLRSLGYAGTVLVPGDQGLFSLYGKMGYIPFCPMKTLTVEAAAEAAPIRPISADTYELLRRQYLPAGGILQENETVAFAATFCEFYTGAHTLLCVSREANTLHFQEYFGDPALLGSVVTALHGKKGIARLPDGNTPTAMYHGFSQGDNLPTYLGIALN